VPTTPAGTGGPDEFERTGLDIHSDLAIVGFNPRGAGFIAKADIQGQGAGGPPVVLNEAGEEPVALMPFSRTSAPADILRETKGPICRRVSLTAVPRIVATGTVPVEQGAQFAGIAAVEHVDVVTIHLKARLDDMPAMSVDQHVIKLAHRGGEFFGNARRAQIGQRPAGNVRNRTAGKTQLGKSVDPGGVAFADANGVGQRSDRTVEGSQPMGQPDVIHAEARFVEQVRREGVVPAKSSALQISFVHHIAQQGYGVGQRVILIALGIPESCSQSSSHPDRN
jgi:hypothetical protein